MTDEWIELDALAQAALVRTKAVTPRELVDATICRIEAVNPRINAVVLEMYEVARRAADDPLPAGPLAGVPFLLKDFCAEYAGVRFTEGTAFLRDYVSPADTELVRRYRRAGLLVVGKTNLPEMAVGP